MPIRSERRRAGWAALVSLAALAPPSWAQEPDDARARAHEAYERGKDLVAKGQLDEAEQAFRLAYQLVPHYVVLFSLGNVEAARGKPAEAIAALERYRREAEKAGALDPERRKEIEQTLAEQRERVASIAVRVTPDGCEVAIDTAVVGTSPLGEPLLVDPGQHVVAASKSGYSAGETTFTTTAKEQREVELHLLPIPPPPPAPPLTALTAPPPPTAPPPVVAKPRPSAQRAIALALGATGVAAGTVAVALFAWNDHRYGNWLAERDALDATYAQASGYDAALAARQGANDGLANSITAIDRASIGLAVAGSTLLIAGVAVYFTDRTAAPALRVTPVTSGGMASYALEF